MSLHLDEPHLDEPPLPMRRRTSPSAVRIRQAFARVRALRGWKSAARELALIVAGVLLALMAQAWWEGRESRDREARYLVRLEKDLWTARLRLQESHFAHMRTATDLELALDLGARARTAPLAPAAADSFRTLAGVLGRVSTGMDAPRSPTYEELRSSGNLQIIRSDSLRAILAEYDALLLTVRAADDFVRAQALNVVQPFLRDGDEASEPGSGTGDDPGAAMLRSRRFRTVATLQMQAENDAVQQRQYLFMPLMRAERLARSELRRRHVDPARGRVVLDRRALNRFVGAYELGDGRLLAISRDQDRLTAELPGLWPIPLYPTSDTAFASADGMITCAFRARRGGQRPAVVYTEAGSIRLTLPLLEVGTAVRAPEIRAAAGSYDAFYARFDAPAAEMLPVQRVVHVQDGRAFYERIYPRDHPGAFQDGSQPLVPVGPGRFWMLGYPLRHVTIAVQPDVNGGVKLQFLDGDGVALNELTLVRRPPAPPAKPGRR